MTTDVDAEAFPVMTWPAGDNPMVVRVKVAQELKRQRDEAREDHSKTCKQLLDTMAQRDELMAALERVIASATPNPRDNPAMYPVWESARAAIAAVKGGE